MTAKGDGGKIGYTMASHAGDRLRRRPFLSARFGSSPRRVEGFAGSLGLLRSAETAHCLRAPRMTARPLRRMRIALMVLADAVLLWLSANMMSDLWDSFFGGSIPAVFTVLLMLFFGGVLETVMVFKDWEVGR